MIKIHTWLWSVPQQWSGDDNVGQCRRFFSCSVWGDETQERDQRDHWGWNGSDYPSLKRLAMTVTASVLVSVYMCTTCGRAAWPRRQLFPRPAGRRWPRACLWCHRSWSGSWGATPGGPGRLQAGRACTESPWETGTGTMRTELVRKTIAHSGWHWKVLGGTD